MTAEPLAAGPVIVVGFASAALASQASFLPDASVIFVEEPDVARKRDVASKVAGWSVVRELLEWEYQLPGAADAFAERHPDLRPAAVIPQVEYAVEFAASLAEHYGVPGAGPAAARLLRDKHLLRRRTRLAGVANPASRQVGGPDEVRAFMAEHPGPVVLKPANRQAAVGTRILREPGEVHRAWADCAMQEEGVYVPDRQMPLRMLVERFVSGSEYSVEMLVRDGAALFRNVSATVLYPGSCPVELGHIVPADLPRALADRLCEDTERVLRAVGFATGIVHCEWIVEAGTPYLVECAGRFAGDGIVALIDRAYEIDLVRSYYTMMRGQPLAASLPRRPQLAAAVWFLHAAPGLVQAVDGVDAARELAGVIECEVSVAPGERIHELRSSWDRVGHAMAAAPTPSEAARRAAAAIEHVGVRTAPGAPAATRGDVTPTLTRPTPTPTLTTSL
jgi:biotin carboxylase